MITYKQQPPPSHLAPWVECIWTMSGQADATPEAILPDGRMEVIFHHGARPNRQAPQFVTGQITTPVLIEPSGPMETVGLRLRPAAAGAFLRMPAHELRDRFVPLQLNPPTEIPDAAITHAVHMIEETCGAVRMDEITLAINCSPRHFDRRFLNAVGLPPKTFARIVRFQSVIAAYRSGQFQRWADLAQSCGFYDQSHLANEFRRFAGAPPATFFRHPQALALLMANFSKTPPSPGGYSQYECVL